MRKYFRVYSWLPLIVALVGGPILANAQSSNDAALNLVRRDDAADRANGAFAQLSAAEHMRRANIYMSNRALAEARQHWQVVIENYPNDVNVPTALFGSGRPIFRNGTMPKRYVSLNEWRDNSRKRRMVAKL